MDRCFNRARYDAEQTVAAFAARLKEALDLDSVLEDLARVVQRTLESAHVSVLNVTATDRDQDAELERLLKLGARPVSTTAWARSGAWPPRAQTGRGEKPLGPPMMIMPRDS